MYKAVGNWFDIIALEKRVLAFWQKHDTFKKLIEKNKDGKGWSFLDGPITANNPMGVHHAWGRALKDAYHRFHAMNGHRLRYQNGFDCQGLWVEVEVEKELKFQSKKDIEAFGIAAFVEKCKERVRKYSTIQTNESIRLGYWMDWNNSYYTMSDENNYTIWSFLKKCHDKGLIYKGNDVMPWCPRCGTGISQHEMQEGYKEVSHTSVIVTYPIIGRDKEAFLVWTTTPWTLSSNVAIAVHPEFSYARVAYNGWHYYLIKEKVQEVFAGKEHTIEGYVKGRQLIDENLRYNGPFDELPAQQDAREDHRVIPWEEITSEEGTGIVHIAPGCGAEDYALGKEHNLAAIGPIDENGVFTPGFGLLEGKHASHVAELVIDNLKQKGILFHAGDYRHSYPHCWRCKHQLLFRLVDEWFIAMEPWKEDIKQVARQIHWIPSFGLDLELDWLTNMRDWMISKKRYWGLALPIWVCPDCGSFEVIGGREELKERAVEGWQEFDGHSPHKPWIDRVKIACSTCGKPISRIPDVGNPWLDAGIVPYSTVHYNSKRDYWAQWIPADLVLECFPGQFRNWFYSLLAMSTMMENIPPFRTLLGHALVRDEHGEEMHKSQGNAIWFSEAVEQIGAEVMRWIFFNQDISKNLNFGFSTAKMVRGKFFNTLWNCYAFYVNYARIVGFAPKPDRTTTVRSDFDRWILSRLHSLIKKCRKAFAVYDLRVACRNIDDFVEDLSNWYIRNNRRRYWRSEMNEDAHAAYQTLFDVLHTLNRLLAPMLPFLSEEIHQNLAKGSGLDVPESVHLADYPEADDSLIDEALENSMAVIMRLNAIALSAREKAKIKIRQPLSRLIICPQEEEEAAVIKRFAYILKENLNVKDIEILPVGQAAPTITTVKPNMKKLGPKYGAMSRQVAEEITRHPHWITDKLDKGESEFHLNIMGKEIVLHTEELHIGEQEPENLSIVQMEPGWVAIDSHIDEDLRIEGLMRDFLRQMQVLRKDIGLAIEDRITLVWHSDSKALTLALERFADFIKSELLCTELTQGTSGEFHLVTFANETIHVRIAKA